MIYRNRAETTNVRMSGVWIMFALIAASFLVYSIYGIVTNVTKLLTKGLQF